MSTRSLKRPGSDGVTNSKKTSPQDEDFFLWFFLCKFSMYFYVFSIDAIFVHSPAVHRLPCWYLVLSLGGFRGFS